jgi:hypothetical protein
VASVSRGDAGAAISLVRYLPGTAGAVPLVAAITGVPGLFWEES